MAEEGEKHGIEQQLERAVCSRLQHFKDQADSLTLESVRRLLEKDLGLEKFALDAHKRFIRQYLEKKMDSADDCKPETENENVDKDVQIIKEGATVLPKQHESNNEGNKSSTGDEEMMEDSPILGVLTPESEAGAQGPLSESRIEKAILERADHFIANSENLTLAGVRRLLEEDLGLDKNALDPFKKFISRQIDMVLSPPKAAKSVKDVKMKTSENLRSKKLKKISSGEGSESSHSESEEIEEVKSKKESASKRDVKKFEQPKKRKISKESHLDVSSKKPSKLPKRQKEEDNESDADGSLSEDDKSHSSVEKPAQRKEKPAPVYGKQVENLKSVIKACGMSVPPSIYKKAKQVSDNKREAFVVKELEGILLREGLSKNPSEKEIKDCRKRKETARELEGIDMSNIISSSRRRSTFSFAAPVKPEARAKKEKVDAKESKKRDKKEKVVENEDEADKAVKEEKVEKDEKEEKEEKEEEKESEEDKESEEEVEEVEDDDDDEEEEDDGDSEDFNEDDNEESD